jgi:peroxiredoxin
MKILFLLLILGSLSLSARSPEERKELFKKATQDLKSTGIEKKPPKVGDTFPDLELDGKKISQWLNEGPLVISFYRGGWCPYCVSQLKVLNHDLKEFTANGARLIAISPEKAQEVRKTKGKNKLDFTLLSDSNFELARKLGLVFKVDSEVAKEYKGLGIDLAQSQGNDGNELPIPATFVIDGNRKVTYAFVDADYTKRADVQDVIKAVKAAARP